ncbi:MAG: hypothetical protein AB1798_02115 [Spirochaetota bacterium]
MSIKPSGRSFVFFGIYVLLSLSLYAKPYALKDSTAFFDLPDGWEALDASEPGKLSFTDADHTAVFQIRSVSGDRFASAEEMQKTFSSQLNASGDTAPFSYSGRDSVLADFTFNAGRYTARGYFIFINGSDYDYILLAFTAAEMYDEMHGFLLSVLDSFSPDKKGIYLSGPVSQFYYPFPGENRKTVNLSFENKRVGVLIDKGEIDAASVLIEREARVLAAFKKDRNEAWLRYYRMIYRDNFHRLDGAYEKLKGELLKAGVDRVDIPVRLLEWIQSFEYARSGTPSDLLSPLETVIRESGDCDSRGLLYIILLKHFGFESILLVSTVYGHSVTAVDIAGKGARFSYNGKNYLIAEMTKPIGIGLIAQDMADPAGWIPMSLDIRY